MRRIVVIKGGGDLASGVAHVLRNSGFSVLLTEIEKPSAIRRHVSFSEAVYHGKSEVEGILCERADNLKQALDIMDSGNIALLIDPDGACIKDIDPHELVAVVDAILAKKNLGTNIRMAPVVVGLGPGFEAGKDVDVVVETMRGHHLGRLYKEGCALANTGVPGKINGYGIERVIHAPCAGKLREIAHIKDIVEEGQVIAYIDKTPIKATLSGVLRGILPDGYEVSEGMKMADIDPRIESAENCDTISDKARCIGGSVLTAILMVERESNLNVLF